MILLVLCSFMLSGLINVVRCDKDIYTKKLLNHDCQNDFSVTCLKFNAMSILDKISDNKEYNVISGVSIVRDPAANFTKNSEIIADMARFYPKDPEKRLNGYLLAKIANYLESHSINVKLMNSDEFDQARSIFEGRKKGKKGGLEAIMGAALMMKSMMMAIGLGALGILAGKALLTALMALVLSAVMGIKALTSGHKSTTYEIIAKPAYTNSHSHTSSHEQLHEHGGEGGYGGYGRSLNFALPEHLTK